MHKIIIFIFMKYFYLWNSIKLQNLKPKTIGSFSSYDYSEDLNIRLLHFHIGSSEEIFDWDFLKPKEIVLREREIIL